MLLPSCKLTVKMRGWKLSPAGFWFQKVPHHRFLFAESKTWRSASHGRTRKGAALRRRQRYPRSICRHEQVAIKMAVASAVNHSAQRPSTTDMAAHTVSEIVLDIGGQSSCSSLSVSALVGDPGVFKVAVTHTSHNPALASRLLRTG